jgi:hypothetical protein
MAQVRRPRVTLRISERCLVEDFGLADAVTLPVEHLEDLAGERSGLIRAFLVQRSTDPEGPPEDRMSGLATGGVPIYILRHGARYRGLTWHDVEAGVVWLIAAHFAHRSGEASDSYIYFRTLTREQLRPSEHDLRRMREQEANQAVEGILGVIPALLREAGAEPGHEVRGQVGPVPIRIMLEPGPPPPHVHLGIGMRRLDHPVDPPPDIILAIVTRVYGHAYDGWEDLPTSSGFGDTPTLDEWAFDDFITDWPRDE